MKKLFITTVLGLSAVTFAGAENATSTRAMPMRAMEARSMERVMKEDPSVGEQVRMLREEMNVKIKALQAEYEMKIKAILEEKKASMDSSEHATGTPRGMMMKEEREMMKENIKPFTRFFSKFKNYFSGVKTESETEVGVDSQ